MSLLRKNLFLFFIFFLFISRYSFALMQNEKLWLGLNSQLTLTQDKKWLAFIFSQFRFINRSHPWQSTLIEGGMGYRLFDDESIWVGYRWTVQNPNNNFYQQNRLFQQFIWLSRYDRLDSVISRTRLEEIEHTNSSEISLLFRQRLAVQLSYHLFARAFPFLYDEIFLQFNRTNYSAQQLFSENRLFIGLNIFNSATTWWEIGYMNQYQVSTPQHGYQMSHILSFTYAFV